MKIAVIHTSVPFYRGGAEVLADAVYEKLRAAGHDMTYYRIPFSWNPSEKVLESLFAVRGMCFDRFEKVIAFKFPTYCVNHPNKTIWLFHQFRQVYDCWGTPYQGVPDTPEGKQIRRAIFAADNQYLCSVKNLYCNSEITANRLKEFNNATAEILYPPLPDESIFFSGDYKDYVFYPSRISGGKRQYLIVEAMRFVKSPVKLILAGLPETAADLTQLQQLIKQHNLMNKVVIHDRFITEHEKAKLMAEALAVAYLPYDEDSYGFVTLEAYYCRRPVITCTDSGGTHLLVKHDDSGFITQPEPKALAEAIDKLYAIKSRLAAMGNSGFAISQKLGMTWENVIKRLTE